MCACVHTCIRACVNVQFNLVEQIYIAVSTDQ